MRAKPAWALLITACVAPLVAGAALAQDRTPTAISNIRQETTDRSTRLFVECTGPVAYTYYSPDPLTLVVDIPEADASQVAPRIAIGTREVESVRVTSMARADGHNLARLEVKLASLVPYQIYSKDKSLNLVFERPAAAAEAKPWPVDKDSKATATTEAAPLPAEAPKPAAEPVAEPAHEKPAPPTVVAEAAEAAPVPRGAKASRILGLTYAEEKGQLAFTVRADGSLRYQDFFLGNPDRLVIDFADVSSRSPVRNLDVNNGPVRKARLAQFSASSPKVARLVLDLSARAPYRIVEGSDGVKILFGEGQTPTPAPLAALRPEADPGAAAASAIPPAALPAPALPAPAPVALPEPQVTTTTTTTERVALEPTTVAGVQKVYTGHPISLDFKDGDLQDIFRLFADISGLNVVVNPGVSGKVTLKLTEVPWDQALDLILKTNGLGYTLEDNVIRIAKLADLQKEEQERRKLAEEKALAGDLLVQNFRLSYAKAKELEPTIKKVALSPRGQIITDDRTNTMIVTDLALNLEKTKNLIADLDRATPQVEIEARIVVTSRTFLQQYGIQWGFLNQQTPLFGNTTGQAFPNSIIVNGGGVPGGGGLAADQTAGGSVLASTQGIGPAARGYAVNLPAAAFNSAIGISLGNILGNLSIDAALTALENSGRGRVISTPKVTTQNNQAAEIKQGVQIPIQTVANNTVTVIFKDAVLTLKVTPQITEAGTVILTLEVENNSPDFSRTIGTGATAVPPINTQSAKTIVLVRDGATAVIGGIYQSTEQTAKAQTPFLGNIPILGYLFRNRSLRTENAELMIFVTPRIIKG
jgi:type IV pilus secretin PilQ/predicted competence protein